MSFRSRVVAVLLVGVGVFASACGSSPSSTALLAGTPEPGLPSFYGVPASLPSNVPGTLIKYQKVTTPKVNGTTFRIMYVSENTEGKPIAVTGFVIVPHTAPPAGGYHIVAWSHGTNGMAPTCAPSDHLDTTTIFTAVPYPNRLLAKNWEIVSSDYEGEGTPGPLPYLVGVLAARNTIDAVRAATNLPSAHASHTFAEWGHSEGGQTALFVLHIAASYAPTLHLVGVVAGAPPSQFNLVYTFLKTSKFRFYLFMAAVGFNKGYGNAAAPLTQVMTESAEKLIPDLTKGCFTYLQKTLDKYKLTGMVKGNPFTNPKWKILIKENDPENFTSPSTVPLLIPQGGTDTQIPTASTLLLDQHLCSIGQDTERWIYPGQDHAGVIKYYMGDMIRWMTDRFQGKPNPDPRKPVGLPDVNVMTCP